MGILGSPVNEQLFEEFSPFIILPRDKSIYKPTKSTLILYILSRNWEAEIIFTVYTLAVTSPSRKKNLGIPSAAFCKSAFAFEFVLAFDFGFAFLLDRVAVNVVCECRWHYWINRDEGG